MDQACCVTMPVPEPLNVSAQPFPTRTSVMPALFSSSMSTASASPYWAANSRGVKSSRCSTMEEVGSAMRRRQRVQESAHQPLCKCEHGQRRSSKSRRRRKLMRRHGACDAVFEPLLSAPLTHPRYSTLKSWPSSIAVRSRRGFSKMR